MTLTNLGTSYDGAIAPGYVNTYLLTADLAKAITPPAGTEYAVFSSTADIWAVIGSGTAAVPSGDTTDGTGSELNPSVRALEGATAISVISESAAKLSVTFYG
jgi:hypothetical protein